MAMTRKELEKIVAQMTVEEKASLCSGGDFWHTKKIDRLGVPQMMMSDGPHGLRKQREGGDHLGVNESIQAVCFPTGCASASSFDRALLQEMGDAIGEACQAEGVGVVLGPAVNIKRSPLCGRNFEYYSEDPYAAGEIAASYIKGAQGRKVGTSIKHFMGNSQETRRMTSDSKIDERTMKEIYLPAFETAVKREQPWTVMCSYNRINGTYAAENKELLTDILRDEWGFEGFVVSDWGAVNDRVEGVKAGLELEMPASCGVNDTLIMKAVKEGKLSEETLDEAVIRILNIVYRFEENRDEKAVFDKEAQHALSKKVADESLVLLKNDDILPLKKDAKIAFIGKYAKTPRYQGGGSSHINSFKVTGALEMAKDMENISFAAGFDDQTDEINEQMIAEAVHTAENAEVAVIFVGLPDSYESEGYDRAHMQMPENQNRLIEEIAKVQQNIVVVLHNGSPVEMPWLSKVKGVLEAYLGGEAVGEAEFDILFGDVNPSGKLSETFPIALEDNPSYLFYIGEEDSVEYREGVFVGYRYYDKKKMNVLFPFGFGLSYTTFAYSNLRLDRDKMKDTELLTVSVDVTNTGAVPGKEVVELYVQDKESTVIRPIKELKGFEKVSLNPGETKTVTMTLDKRAFAYYNTQIHEFHVESGEFDILVGGSSRDIALKASVYVESTKIIPKRYHLNTTFGDINKDPKAAKLLEPLYRVCTMTQCCEIGDSAAEAISKAMQDAMMEYIPLRGMVTFQEGGTVDFDKLSQIVNQLNNL